MSAKNSMRAAGQWIVDRVNEPSTWAGAAAAVASMSFIPHATDIAAQIPVIGAGVMGVIAIIIKEKSKPVIVAVNPPATVTAVSPPAAVVAATPSAVSVTPPAAVIVSPDKEVSP